MAIFNRDFLNETVVGCNGRQLLTDKERNDPKFRKAQYDKVYAFVKDTCESEAFKEKFNISISLFNYYEDDDEADIFNKWISRKGPYVLDITYKLYYTKHIRSLARVGLLMIMGLIAANYQVLFYRY